MFTYFEVGNVLRSNSSSQGLEPGALYSVVALHERNTFAGNFVTYELARVFLRGSEVPPAATLLVRNAHLLLSRAS